MLSSKKLTRDQPSSKQCIALLTISAQLNVGGKAYIGAGVSNQESNGERVLMGTTGGGIPYVRAQQDEDNYVQMVGNNGQNFLEVKSNGEIVFEVDDSGATYKGQNNGVRNSNFRFNLNYETPPGPASFNNYVISNRGALMIAPTGGTITFTGISSLDSGSVIVISNRGGSNLVLSHQGGSSNSSNRIITPSGANYTISPGGGAMLIYDGNSSRWRFLSAT